MGQKSSKTDFANNLETITVTGFRLCDKLIQGFLQNDSLDCLYIKDLGSGDRTKTWVLLERQKKALQFYRISNPAPYARLIVKYNDKTALIENAGWAKITFNYEEEDTEGSILKKLLNSFLDYEKFATTFVIENVDTSDFIKVDDILKSCARTHSTKFTVQSNVAKGSLVNFTIKKTKEDEKDTKQYLKE